MNSDHTAHRSRIEPFDIVKPNVTLARAPGVGWIVLCEDCLAHQGHPGLKVIAVSQGLNFKPRDSLSAWQIRHSQRVSP